MAKNISIYIHIPFCVRKCSYCDFLSFSASKDIQDRYFKALINEIKCAGPWLNAESTTYVVKSIFFGGGTPSSVDPAWIVKILDTIRDTFDVAKDAEITIEMNPGTVTPESLAIYKKFGINRISIGCQSLNDNELKELGRIHDSKTFYDTFHAARAAGFDNINVDLMSALPGQTIASYKDTLAKIVALRPEHISAYSLIIEEGTPFYEKYKDVIERDLYDIEDDLVKEGVVYKNDIQSLDAENDVFNGDFIKNNNIKNDAVVKNNSGNIPAQDVIQAEQVLRTSDNASNIVPLPSEEEERQMYEDTITILNQNGYHRYEVSNYVRNDGDYECYHNKAYWKRYEYLGLGLGAAGMVADERYTNTDGIKDYCAYWYDFGICDKTRHSEDDLDEGNIDNNNIDNNNIDKHPNIDDMTDSNKSDMYALRPLLEHDKLSVDACMEETMFLGLRMDVGISVSDFEHRFDRKLEDVYGKVIQKLEKEALILLDNDRLKLTEKGLEVSNAVLSDFLIY